MPWFHFTANFNYAVTPARTIAYRAGMVEFVQRSCADKAMAAGKGKVVARPAGRAAAKGSRHGQA